MNPHTNRICLGTAQFGMDYGIANTKGRMSDEDIKSVLRYALAHGVTVADTAAAYGTSEETIGRSLKYLNRSLNVISKLPSDAEGKANTREVVTRSLKRLGAGKIYGYLLHSFEDFRKPDIWQELNALKSEGIVEKIGFSLYHTKEAEELLRSDVKFDLLQIPYSVFDRRFTKYLPLFKERRVEIYARSVFLQGLAFLDPNNMPASVHAARTQVHALRKISVKGGFTLSALCLNFALVNPNIDRVIIGVDHPDHLKINLSDLRFFAKTKAIGEDFNGVIIEDEDILLPYRWKK